MKHNIEICMKISKKQWIESLRNGTACFSPVGVFINQAATSGNNEQGDWYEGIFARMRKTDLRLPELKVRLGDDLEIIDDHDYVMLRRKSIRKLPIFCMYGIDKNELVVQEDTMYKEAGEWIGKVRYDFPEKMYKGSLDEDDVWAFYVSAGHFHDALDVALQGKGLTFRKTVVAYDIDPDAEFYIEPDEQYSELDHKRKDLAYQHEIRYTLLNFPREEYYLVQYEPLEENSCGIAQEVYLEMNCKIDILE